MEPVWDAARGIAEDLPGLHAAAPGGVVPRKARTGRWGGLGARQLLGWPDRPRRSRPSTLLVDTRVTAHHGRLAAGPGPASALGMTPVRVLQVLTCDGLG